MLNRVYLPYREGDIVAVVMREGENRRLGLRDARRTRQAVAGDSGVAGMTTLAAKIDWVTITLPEVSGMKRTRDMPRDQAISILRHAAEMQDTIEGIGEDGQPMTVHQPAYSPEDIAAMTAQADAIEADAR